jgi:hypothetical protein
MKFTLILSAAFFIGSCANQSGTTNEKPLARVYDTYLYPSHLKGVVASGVSTQDSLSIVHDFIEKWVRNQLLLNIAEVNLTEQEKDVAREIENYRSSLLIYAYQQSYLHMKLDTLVDETEMEAYYKENQANFILNEPMMKGLIIKLPLNAPELHKVRQWYKSDNSEDLKQLEAYCFKNAAVYDHFNENWVNVNEVIRMIPADDKILLNTLKNSSCIEIKDQNYYYFVSARELAAEGTTTPYELVTNNIHSIILNKRKVRLINELETSIFNNAQNREHFTIYK